VLLRRRCSVLRPHRGAPASPHRGPADGRKEQGWERGGARRRGDER
jgi:hypothetical protein